MGKGHVFNQIIPLKTFTCLTDFLNYSENIAKIVLFDILGFQLSKQSLSVVRCAIW